jgi:hypothetical protein
VVVSDSLLLSLRMSSGAAVLTIAMVAVSVCIPLPYKPFSMGIELFGASKLTNFPRTLQIAICARIMLMAISMLIKDIVGWEIVEVELLFAGHSGVQFQDTPCKPIPYFGFPP